jgi:NAD(P)-dependent dehydrogenase (short-subunit alcohol dehydrogenase family)
MKALVTGAASGIGRAIADRLGAEGYDVAALDVGELDVSNPAAWMLVTAGLNGLGLDVACLNAGVITGTSSISELTDAQYRRILDVNVGGTVFGVRALLPALEAAGGKVVVTASLAGLTTMPNDPIYAGTKHFLVGFVRSVAPELAARGVSINAVCPGIVDTPLLGEDGRAALDAAGFPLLTPEDVAAAVATVLEVGGTGEAWVVQPGRDPEPYQFHGVPGPRVPGAIGVRPPM